MAAQKMKALNWSSERGSVALIETAAPTVPSAPDQVIVKVAYAGVCGTNLHIMSGEFMGCDDVIMGHEIVGVITAVGSDVTNCKLGDRVIVDPNTHCGKCRFCLRGKINCCETEGINFTYGVFRPGGWAEYCQILAKQIHVLPPSLDLPQGLLCEPLSCILNGYSNCGDLPDDTEILLMGAGVIGLLWATLFHYKGYRDVTILELSQDRRKIAENLGLGFKVCHPDEIKSKMAAVRPDVEGFDLIVDTTGSARAAEMAFDWVRRGGTYNIFGCCPKEAKMTIRPAEFMLREISIRGSMISCFTYPKTVALVNNLAAEKYLDYEKLGIKVYNMEESSEAFASLRSGKISKAVFEINPTDDLSADMNGLDEAPH